tara:strand:+ start:722 stop:1354 length:633 start_codon:yes stop_codon:yes gene_type:complete
MKENSLVIQIGDFGFGFSSTAYQIGVLDECIKLLEEKNSELYIIRGNHDDPAFFTGTTKNRITALRDYTYLSVNGEVWGFIGGATSIDRFARREGISYWRDEKFVFDADKIQPCEVLFMHNAPQCCEPVASARELRKVVERFVPGVGNGALQNVMVKDLTEERDALQEAFYASNPRFFYYGHFHYSHEEKVNGCHCTLLDINEVKKIAGD